MHVFEWLMSPVLWIYHWSVHPEDIIAPPPGGAGALLAAFARSQSVHARVCLENKRGRVRRESQILFWE